MDAFGSEFQDHVTALSGQLVEASTALSTRTRYNAPGPVSGAPPSSSFPLQHRPVRLSKRRLSAGNSVVHRRAFSLDMQTAHLDTALSTTSSTDLVSDLLSAYTRRETPRAQHLFGGIVGDHTSSSRRERSRSFALSSGPLISGRSQTAFRPYGAPHTLSISPDLDQSAQMDFHSSLSEAPPPTASSSGSDPFGRAMSSSSSPPPTSASSPRSKKKKFDIKISHLSDLPGNDDFDYSGQDPHGEFNRGSTASARTSAGGPVRTKRQRIGRERVRIELAPDQPPTTQGRQRERVYVACLQCRSRKIRCDGAKPMCHNCHHRSTGICEYDAVPKRRGPDRQPGSRQRPGKKGDRGQSGADQGDSGGGASDQERASTSNSPPAAVPSGQSTVHPTVRPHANEQIADSHTAAAKPARRRRSTAASSRSQNQLELPIAVPDQPGMASSSSSNVDLNSTWASIPPASTVPSARLDFLGGTPSTSSGQHHHAHNFNPQIAIPHDVIPQNAGATPSFAYSVSQSHKPFDGGSDSLDHAVELGRYVPRISAGSLHPSYSNPTPPLSASENYAVDYAHNLPVPPANVAQYNANTYSGRNSISSGSHISDEAGQVLSLLSNPFGDAGHSLGVVGQNDLARMRNVSGFSSSASPESTGFAEVPSPDLPLPGQAHSQPVIVDPIADPQLHSDYVCLPLQHAQPQFGSSAVFLNVGGDMTNFDSNSGCLAPQLRASGLVAQVTNAYNPYQWAVGDQDNTQQQPTTTAFITSAEEEERAQRHQQHSHATHISHPPSLEYTRKSWWDSLLDTYCAEEHCPLSIVQHNQTLYGITASLPRGFQPNSTTRDQASQLIIRDLQFLFKNSNYWFAFINVPLFFTDFFDPMGKQTIQPALVLAILTMSNFLRSSNAELGPEGMARTLWLREKAQAALEASMNSSWIDPGLAQAAWILSVFEVSAHPIRSTSRTESAFTIMDNIIRTLSLTYIDAEDPSTTAYSPRNTHNRPSQTYPAPPTHKSHVYPLPLYNRHPISDSHHPQARHTSQLLQYQSVPSHAVHGTQPGQEQRKCFCTDLSLGRNWHGAQEHTPLWYCTPAWNPDWSIAEIRREECRRLCWNALSIAAGYTTYRSSLGVPIQDLFILQPSNFRLLFPGENLSGLPALSTPGAGDSYIQASNETVWALYARSMLLWHACVRIRTENVSDHERAIFANSVWLEADAIENALNGHTCQTERAFLFQGREYLFNARMYVSHEYRRFVPHPSPEMSGSVHRHKAKEWLTHQATVSKRVMMGLHAVTGLKNNVLAKRPFFIFWFMSQISRCLQLWSLDKSLTVAVQLAKDFLPPIDYLTALWPCDDQRIAYAKLRQRLEQACHEVGLDPPPPPNLVLPSALP